MQLGLKNHYKQISIEECQLMISIMKQITKSKGKGTGKGMRWENGGGISVKNNMIWHKFQRYSSGCSGEYML